MALKQQLAVKNVIGNADLELKADTGKAYRVWDVFTYDPTLDYVTVKIEKTTVGYFRTRSVLGGHQVALRGRKTHSHHIYVNAGLTGKTVDLYPIINAADIVSKFCLAADHSDLPADLEQREAVRYNWPIRNETLLGYLRRKGIWRGWPVAEGETFRLSGAKNTNARQVITYEIFEPGDIKPEDENGSKSKEYLFINYGNCGGSIQATVDNLFNTSVTPAEFPDFPFGKTVPPKYQIDLIGICGSPFAPKENNGSAYTFTQYLKLMKDREILFDEDRNGIIFECRQLDLTGRGDMFAEGISLIGNKSEYDDNDPLMFEPPITFFPGDELGIYLSLAVGTSGQAITTAEHELALIEKVRRVE